MHKQIRKIASKTAFVLAVAAVGCDGSSQSNQAGWSGGRDQQRTPSVEAVEVLYGTLPLEERLSGTVRARVQTEIYSEVAAPITEVLVNDGDFVVVGDPLVRLRGSEFEERLRQAISGQEVAEARLRQTEAALNRLEANLRRIESLAERGLTSETELEVAQADVLSARADVDLMRAQRDQAASQVSERRLELSNTIIRAPITGVVGSRTAELGQHVNTSVPLFVIGDPTAMRVRITLTERMLSYIEPGTSVQIVTDAEPDQVIRGRIDRISPFLHPVTHTTQAEIDLEEDFGDLRSGMFVTVDVLYGESELSALVPNSAIYRHPRDGREGVYVTSLGQILARHGIEDDELADGQSLLELSFQDADPQPVEFVPVNVVARGRLLSGVTGVEPGDWVVTLGHHMLTSRDAPQALVQPTPWEHIMNLQQMQSRDLLNIILDRVASRDIGG